MAYGLVLVFDGASEEQYWSVNEKLGIDRDGKGDYPPGLIVHLGGATPSGWVVTEVWDTKDSQVAFMESQLGAALQASGVPAPSQVIETDAVNFQQP
ncbi:MAG: hypothetical protein HYX32_04800 [Actinobacteria bacterium]|nr:hypothetical protein [Actinomycetota bacterium]